ncbi:hypothetical protein HPP92_017996 [Vanilla planifolia]|uniref:Calmodulin-binding protein n=1 Tax=Vanilla planifolia TaxID=51239 RepID=A0A835UP38_VANPL|nr:hypothetical protein HPP92_017996 [Vanilla planifolia]
MWSSVIVEALKVDSLQKLCSSLEPVLRRVVSEEVERALAKLSTSRLGSRTSPRRLGGPVGRNLQLQFRSRLSLPIFTGGKVEGEQGAAIHVVLIDANNGHVVTSGPESSAKLDVLVLEGDFNNEEDEIWTEEEFQSHIVKEREGRRPLVTGDLQVTLKEGVGTLGEIMFTDNSSWIRSRKFRLGLRIASSYSEGIQIRIREAKTEAFTVKDHRGELYKKHYPPALKDEVWRLEKIGKDGAFHKKLSSSGISTVEDFLRLFVRDPQRLRNILGSGMSNKMWDVLVEHAKTCVLSGKHYIYYSDDTRSIGAVFNNIYEFTGLIANEKYFSAESLNDSQKIFADALVKKAYEDWGHVVQYDGKALLGFKQKRALRTETSSASSINPASYTQQASHQQLASPSAVERPSINAAVNVGGVASSGYLLHNSSYVPQSQFMSPNNMNARLGPPQPGSSAHHPARQPVPPPTIDYHNGWSRPRDDDFFSEEEIRVRSHEILENEDMQQLLRMLSMGAAAANIQEDGYGFASSPFLDCRPEYDCGRSSGKAVIGWLKIKAAMRWGIFIRKKAAERRAHLIELEEQ